MAHSCRIYDQQGQYFVTCTVHQWVDVFTRADYFFTELLVSRTLRQTLNGRKSWARAWIACDLCHQRKPKPDYET